jgi:hypothetical protein
MLEFSFSDQTRTQYLLTPRKSSRPYPKLTPMSSFLPSIIKSNESQGPSYQPRGFYKNNSNNNNNNKKQRKEMGSALGFLIPGIPYKQVCLWL